MSGFRNRKISSVLLLSSLFSCTHGSDGYPSNSIFKTLLASKWNNGPGNTQLAGSSPALTARYIVNVSNWTAIASISTKNEIKNYPFVNLKSLSDGTIGSGSGIPYMYLTPLDFTGKDIQVDNRVTLMMSLAQSDYCKDKDFDPMDPRCARIFLSGKVVEIEKNSAEYPAARDAFFGRHRWLANMPQDHHFYLAKLDIKTIDLINGFGGAVSIPVDEYFHPEEF